MSSLPRILRIAPGEVALLRSTVNIGNLADVVEELFMNSLDGNATNVDISINLAGNSLAVEDNGDGIIPDDMKMIGVRYCTSKTPTGSTPTFGCRGEFLSSLANSSILTMYSRSRDYRSTHVVKYHYGMQLGCDWVVDPSWMLPKCGTRVLVSKLFGNLPVRVAARERMTASAIAKEWKDIKRKITEVALLHAKNGKGVKVVVRDEKCVRKAIVDVGSGDELDLNDRVKRVMEQAGFGGVLWEGVKGTWNGLQMEGVMGLVPVMDGERQFIFVNGHSVPKNGNSILYSKVADLFRASAFSTADANPAPERGPKLIVRKGTERHPSFVLFLQTAGQTYGLVHPEHLEAYGRNNNILLDITKLIEVVVDEFLVVGGWKKKAIDKRKREESVEASITGTKKPILGWRRRADMIPLDMMVAPRHRLSNLAFSERANTERVARQPSETVAPRSQAPVAAPSGASRYFDPKTNEYFWLDDRTGNEIKPQAPQVMPKRLTLLPGKPKTAKEWRELAAKYAHYSYSDNTVFPCPEQQIPRNSLVTGGVIKDDKKPTSTGTINKLSLQTARVIAQVENKFILLTLQCLGTLVVVDQHAADERVRVEKIWRHYDNRPMKLRKPVNFILDANEAAALELYTPGMMEWGFEFTARPIVGGGAAVFVVGTPPLVVDKFERDQTVVEELLRGWIRELKEGRFEKYSAGKEKWMKRMTTATKGLVEVINSRACRGAIMFNDELTLEQCRELIRKLGTCEFPFSCAHGRPTMVPMVCIAGGGVEDGFFGDKCGDICSHDI
ncbi:DNA mismatch repair protein [Orbilia blumenaviensis]|uniref:DNA mismatch repair protein n=1 Tax=Orbilia blumenaviensis TaxID=1796055 RepID=A0AAV9UPC6_9PEZI